jgi:hypothetical protein
MANFDAFHWNISSTSTLISEEVGKKEKKLNFFFT